MSTQGLVRDTEAASASLPSGPLVGRPWTSLSPTSSSSLPASLPLPSSRSRLERQQQQQQQQNAKSRPSQIEYSHNLRHQQHTKPSSSVHVERRRNAEIGSMQHSRWDALVQYAPPNHLALSLVDINPERRISLQQQERHIQGRPVVGPACPSQAVERAPVRKLVPRRTPTTCGLRPRASAAPASIRIRLALRACRRCQQHGSRQPQFCCFCFDFVLGELCGHQIRLPLIRRADFQVKDDSLLQGRLLSWQAPSPRPRLARARRGGLRAALPCA